MRPATLLLLIIATFTCAAPSAQLEQPHTEASLSIYIPGATVRAGDDVAVVLAVRNDSHQALRIVRPFRMIRIEPHEAMDAQPARLKSVGGNYRLIVGCRSTARLKLLIPNGMVDSDPVIVAPHSESLVKVTVPAQYFDPGTVELVAQLYHDGVMETCSPTVDIKCEPKAMSTTARALDLY